MVRRRECAVSNHEAPPWPHPSRRRFAAPQDEGTEPVASHSRDASYIAFPSEVDTGSREENASKSSVQGFGSGSIRTEALSRSGSGGQLGPDIRPGFLGRRDAVF